MGKKLVLQTHVAPRRISKRGLIFMRIVAEQINPGWMVSRFPRS